MLPQTLHQWAAAFACLSVLGVLVIANISVWKYAPRMVAVGATLLFVFVICMVIFGASQP